MERTRFRPIPSGRVKPSHALVLGIAMGVFGVAWLAVTVNALSSILAAATIFIYIAAYTPLKRRTSLCTIVGAISGAIPPVIGWGGGEALVRPRRVGLVWHSFYVANAALPRHRVDVSRRVRAGGFRHAPRDDTSGSKTATDSLLYTFALIVITLIPYHAGMNGEIYLGGALLLDGVMLLFAVQFLVERERASARRLFLASILFLPLILGLMVFTRRERAPAVSRPPRGGPAVRPPAKSARLSKCSSRRRPPPPCCRSTGRSPISLSPSAAGSLCDWRISPGKCGWRILLLELPRSVPGADQQFGRCAKGRWALRPRSGSSSISVDPEKDTTDVLKVYAERFKAARAGSFARETKLPSTRSRTMASSSPSPRERRRAARSPIPRASSSSTRAHGARLLRRRDQGRRERSRPRRAQTARGKNRPTCTPPICPSSTPASTR